MKSKKDSLKTEKENLEAMGNRLIGIRRKLRISQKEFAASLEMSPSYLSTIESGNGNPGVGFFFRLSTTYNVSLDYLFFGAGEMFENRESRKKPGKEFIDTIDTFDDIRWLMENSPMFRNTIIGFSNKFFYENEEIIKRNIKKNQSKTR
jgi:transcriptional regulator with XRE-family HTH domain